MCGGLYWQSRAHVTNIARTSWYFDYMYQILSRNNDWRNEELELPWKLLRLPPYVHFESNNFSCANLGRLGEQYSVRLYYREWKYLFHDSEANKHRHDSLIIMLAKDEL